MPDYATAMGKTVEDLKKELNDNQMAYFENRAKTTAALDLLWNSAAVTDETAETRRCRRNRPTNRKKAGAQEGFRQKAKGRITHPAGIAAPTDDME